MPDKGMPIVEKTAAATAALNLIGGMTPSESRELSRNRHRGRLSALNGKLPNRCYQTVVRSPVLYQGRYARALLGEASLREVIKSKCEECVGFEDVRNCVGDCRSYSCPLHYYRPYQPKKQAEEQHDV